MTITIGNSQGIPMGKYTPSTGGGGGGGADLTSYYTKTETDGLLDEKQDVFATSLPLSYETFDKIGTAYFKSNGVEISDLDATILQTACLLATYNASNPGNMPGFDRSKSWSVIVKEMHISTSTSYRSAQYVLDLRPFNGAANIYRPADTTGVVRFNTNIGNGSWQDVSLPSGYYDFKLEYDGVDYITLSYKATVSEDWIIVASSTYSIPPYPQGTSDYTYCQVGSEAAGFSLKNITFVNNGIRLFDVTENRLLGLKYDNQTIQVNSEGELVANLDELGNEVNAISGRVTALENNDPKTSIINEVTSGVIGKAYNSDGTEVTDLTSQVVGYPTLYKPKSVIAFSKQDSIEIAGKATFKTIYDSSAGVCFEVFKRENNTVQLNHRLQRLWGESIVGLVVDSMTPQETFSINEGDTVRFIYKYNGGANTVELLYAINADTNFTSLGVVNASTPYASEGSDEAYIQLSPELNDQYPSSSSGVVEFPADYTVKINGNLVFSGNWVEPFIDNKADADLSNCTRPYIVEAYRDGYSWRRIYSDGWCEQGGRVLSGEWQGTTQLLKAYKDTNYNIIGTIARNGWGTSTDAYNYFVSAEPANNDSFLWATIGHAGTQGFRPFQWYACGYIE